MAEGRETGKGLVTIDYGNQDPHNPFPVKRILFHNFNFDGDEVKPEHQAELDKRVVSQIIEKRQFVKITGHASKQGDANYNVGLSRRRALAIRDYLIGQGVPPQFVPLEQLEAHGEADSTSVFEDDELDRGVTVEFLPNVKPKPRPPKPLDPPPPPPDIIIKPPFITPTPVPENLSRSVLIREVYINHTLITHGAGGESKGEREIDGWRRIDDLTRVGIVPTPFQVEVKIDEDNQFFTNPIQLFSSQRDQFDLVVYLYKYDPESTPGLAVTFKLPRDSKNCFNLYNKATPVQRLPQK